MKKRILAIFFLLSGTLSFAQNETRNWYFGEQAGLYFSPGAPLPTALTNGQLNLREGCSSVSDKTTGALLFYTDGLTVYNASHQVMQNGDNLLGNYSSTQSALIVPKPGTTNNFFVFTSGVNSNTPATGVRYSEVDVSADQVLPATKNTVLMAPGLNSEKLAGTQHSNGIDYWVIAHDLDQGYYAFLVTAAGVSNVPVISTIGSSHSGQFNNVGYLKFSPSGAQVANALNGDQMKVEVFSFNTTSGVVSGPGITISNVSAAYGVEFSQSEQYLYVSNLNRPNFPYTGIGEVCQYDLLAGTETAINQSKHVYRSTSGRGFGALQLAPNGAILVSSEGTGSIGQTHLDMIVKPDNSGSGATYVTNAVQVGTSADYRRALIGLPNFLSHYFKAPGVNALPEAEEFSNLDLHLFPNPASHFLHYKISGTTVAPAHFVLYDLTGRLIFERSLAASQGTILLPKVAPGSYVVSFSGAGGRKTSTLVIE